MRFADFTLTIGERPAGGYAATALATGLGRVAAPLPPPPVALTAALTRAAGRQAARQTPSPRPARMLFDWAFPPPIRTQLRVAWDRAERAGDGCACGSASTHPSWPRGRGSCCTTPSADYTFATSASTPLVRFYDQTDRFGAVSRNRHGTPHRAAPGAAHRRRSGSRPREKQRGAGGRGDGRRAARASARGRGRPGPTWPTRCCWATIASCTLGATAASSTAGAIWA